MNLKLLKQYIANKAPKKVLNELHTTKNLVYEIQNLRQLPSIRTAAERVESVLGHVMEIEKDDKFSFNRKTPKLLDRLDTLMQMLYSGVHVGLDLSEVEILQKQIVADLKKL